VVLFDKLFASKPDTTVARAILIPSIGVMASDGQMDDRELHQLNNVVSFSPIFSQLDGKTLTGLCKDILTSFNNRGARAVYAEAKAVLSPALRETAMCFALRIASADGRLEEGEREALSYLAAEFEISMETFEAMATVLGMMQRPASA
jgi:tellurite resistance protein